MLASGGDSVHVGRRGSPSGQAPSGQAPSGQAPSGLGPSWEDRWSRGPDTGPREIPADIDATAGVVRRLQARVDRHRWLLARMQSDPLQPEPAGLPELLETVARMRRDTESLLMLHGQDPGVPPGPARRLADVLAAAASAAEEPRRVDVRTVPGADVTPAAATELLHVLAEVVDHVTAVYPGARVDVCCAAEAPGGVVVEVRAGGATRHDPEGLGGRRALGAAQRLAQRSLSGIVLRSPDGGARDAGPVATIHCPGSVVTLDPAPTREPDRGLTAWSARRNREPGPIAREPFGDAPGPDTRPAPRPDVTRLRGEPDPAADPLAFGSDLRRSAAPPDRQPDLRQTGPQPADLRAADELDPLSGPLPLDRMLAESTLLEPPPPGAQRLDFTPLVPDLGHRTNGGGRNGHDGVPSDRASDHAPSAGSQVDELFGPMADLAHDPADDDATPIFAAVASAWFREDEPDPAPARHIGQSRSPVNGYANGHSNGHATGAARPGPRHGGGEGGDPGNGTPAGGGPRNWETPSDVEWRAAAERAARPEPEAQTATGLPRRRPGNQLVPPPRGGAGVPEVEHPDRVPDRVRDRLSTYQRGLRQGRHRADPGPADSDPGDPAAW
ncbi:hypothetical protein [uncultured Pseudonocardia sp.]|uniref:hypothetical protein n=2 Tax=Pseudonocardia TaxID=1847 RepID=UPI00261CB055|nr:hypothetical protein [uncultured Pseudonocardia sp.]